MNTTAALLTALCALSPGLLAQCDLVDVSSTMSGHLFNHTIDRCADVNGDGIADLAVGDPRAVPPVVRIVSGATGAPLMVIAAPAGASFFGTSVASIGDTNGDGIAELAIGTSTSTSFPKGVAFLYSLAAPSSPLATLTDTSASTLMFGRQVAAAGDVDSDGIPDVLVSVLHTGLDGGEIQVRSGATGANVRTLQSGPLGEASGFNSDFGVGLAGGADVTGDGVPDVIVGAPFSKQGGTIFGRVKLYSGATGAVVRTEVGTVAGAQLGSDVAFIADVDQDGVADIAIGGAAGPGIAANASGVKIESGATGATLRMHPGITMNSKLGFAVRAVGDVDGDGRGDYGATGFSPFAAILRVGRDRVVGRDGSRDRRARESCPGPNRADHGVLQHHRTARRSGRGRSGGGRGLVAEPAVRAVHERSIALHACERRLVAAGGADGRMLGQRFAGVAPSARHQRLSGVERDHSDRRLRQR
jgi:hypothetical protein